MLKRLARISRLLALPLTAASLAAVGLAGCSTAGPADAAIEEADASNVLIDARSVGRLAPGERLSVDLRARDVVAHVAFDGLDFSRVDLAFGDEGKAPLAEVMAPLFSHPYSPLEAADGRFVITADPANIPELTADDIAALEAERMIAREHGSRAPTAQPQSIDDCVEQTIYFYVDIVINDTVQSVLCAHTIVVCGSTTCDMQTHNGHNYLFCDGQESWTDAKASCASQGMSLVTLNDAEEEAWVNRLASTYSTQKWWMGMNDRASEGTFAWDSGDAVSYTNWYPGEPNNVGNEDCGQLNRFYPEPGWNDEPCSLHLRYICESD
ncbi:C-type lectin domain-containing protein [Sorangium sp. So ce406]|uniref:C-type lectin domain-containing protein n=1 Tax=Sorangium sp. So ce406 TaxID=3133311 RepID=UPI003F5C065B